MKLFLKRSVPVIILLSAVSAYAVMQRTAVVPDIRLPETKVVSAAYIEVQPQSTVTAVKSQGTVQPCTQTMLLSEVAGRIVRVAPGFHVGAAFTKGELLLEIDDRDYHEAVAREEAVLARAKLNLATEEARARQARRDWKALSPKAPTALALRQPQLAEARAAVRSARAAVDRSRRDLLKTRIVAPYDLMLRSKSVDVNQYVTPGTPLAQVFSVKAVEIRLPVTDDAMALLDDTLRHGLPVRSAPGPSVKLTVATAGRRHVWQGEIVRTEGIYDPKTRVTHIVARVKDPYGLGGDNRPVPMAVGMFVEAQVEGKRFNDHIVIPPRALQDGDSVWVIGDDNTLVRRKVAVAFADARRVVIDSGLTPGEKVCLEAVDGAAHGMPVHPVLTKGFSPDDQAVEQ